LTEVHGRTTFVSSAAKTAYSRLNYIKLIKKELELLDEFKSETVLVKFVDKDVSDFVAKMDPDERKLYQSYRHLRVEAAFDSRVFVAFETVNREGNKIVPNIVGAIKVIDFECTSKEGSTILVEDLNSGEKQIIDHIPSLVFDYPVFMFTATAAMVQYGLWPTNGKEARSLSYPIMLKTQHKPSLSHPGTGTVHIETKRKLQALFPNEHIDFSLVSG
jgi:hypothetical protein